MAKKMKRFSEGGYEGDDPIVKYRMGIKDKEPEFETKTGKNEAIKDDTRERAMRFVEKAAEDKKEVTPKTTATSSKVVAKAKESVPMPKASVTTPSAEERSRESQALLNRKPAPKFDPAAEVGVRRPAAAPDFMMKSMGYKKGGFVSHNDHVKQHAAGFKHHDDHVKAMCGGGYTGKKAK